MCWRPIDGLKGLRSAHANRPAHVLPESRNLSELHYFLSLVYIRELEGCSRRLTNVSSLLDLGAGNDRCQDMGQAREVHLALPGREAGAVANNPFKYDA